MEDLRRKEESKRRFAEREARMRQASREFAFKGSEHTDAGDNDGRDSEERGYQAWAIGLDDEVEQTTAKGTTNNSRRPKAGREQKQNEKDEKEEEGDARSDHEGTRVDAAELRAVEKRRKRNGKPCRPMWAMTEAKAKAEDELKHEEELEVSG